MEQEQYYQIGCEIPDPPPPLFELVMKNHVEYVCPNDYGLSKLKDLNGKPIKGVDPSDYFITSGDAVEKAKIMDRDLWKFAGDLRKQLLQAISEECKCDGTKAQQLLKSGSIPKALIKFHEFEAAVWKAAGQCRKLVNMLKLAKGENCFLETEWNDRKLLCIPKNPRKL